jgi:predicted nucleotidyltransferase
VGTITPCRSARNSPQSAWITRLPLRKSCAEQDCPWSARKAAEKRDGAARVPQVKSLTGDCHSRLCRGTPDHATLLTLGDHVFDLSSWNLSMVTDVSNLPIRFDRDQVAGFCRDRGIIRLSLFGSVLREDFDPARSDIDVLADFKPEATRGIGFRFFGYGDQLAGILGRKVDFCSRLDPRLEPSIRREAVTIYEDS